MTEPLGPQIPQPPVGPEFWPLDAALLPSASLAPGSLLYPSLYPNPLSSLGPISAPGRTPLPPTHLPSPGLSSRLPLLTSGDPRIR